MDLKTILFLLANLALMLSGYIYGWKFLRKRNYLLGLEWWIVAISATSFFAFALSEVMAFYDLSIYLDAFSRGFGFPVIAVVGALAITHGYAPSRWLDVTLFALGFAGAYVLVAAAVVEPVKPWFYLVMGIGFAVFLVYLAVRLLRAGERLNAVNLLVVMATSMAIAGIYDFYSIPGDDADRTIFYTLALASWAYLLTGFYYAYCALERSGRPQ